MATSMLDWIMDLMSNNDAREAFEANPQAAMAAAGMTAVCGEDVADARTFVLDHPKVHPAKEVHADASGKDAHSGASDGDAADQIRYIVSNYKIDVDSHDTYTTRDDNDNDNENDNENANENANVVDVDVEGSPAAPSVDPGVGEDPEIDVQATGDEQEQEQEGDADQSDSEVGRDQTSTQAQAGEDLVQGDQLEFESEVEDFAGEDNVEGLIAINDTLNLEDINALAVDLEDAELLNDSLNGVANGVLNGVGVGILGTGTGDLPVLP